jgi:hypothetical protein
LNFFKSTKSLIIFIIGFVLIAVLGFGVVLLSDNYASSNKTEKTTEPVLELITDKVIIATGDEFDAKVYIKTAIDSNGNDMKDSITAPELDTTNAGTYEITYSFKDGDEVIKSKTLKVIVANKQTEGDSN